MRRLIESDPRAAAVLLLELGAVMAPRMATMAPAAEEKEGADG